MLLKNIASQGVYLFAYTASTGAAKTGDAANITGSVSKDGAASASTGTANPTEIGGGIYWQPLAQGETNANAVALYWASTTAGVLIDPLIVLTSGANLPTAAPAASGGFLTFGSSTGQINPSSGKIPATLASTDVTGIVSADIQTIKTQAVTAAAGVTFPTSLASPTNITAASGVVLAITGLDAIAATTPSGIPTTFPGKLLMVYQRFFGKTAKAASGSTLKVYANDNTTVIATQTWSDDGAGTESLTAAS